MDGEVAAASALQWLDPLNKDSHRVVFILSLDLLTWQYVYFVILILDLLTWQYSLTGQIYNCWEAEAFAWRKSHQQRPPSPVTFSYSAIISVIIIIMLKIMIMNLLLMINYLYEEKLLRESLLRRNLLDPLPLLLLNLYSWPIKSLHSWPIKKPSLMMMIMTTIGRPLWQVCEHQSFGLPTSITKTFCDGNHV